MANTRNKTNQTVWKSIKNWAKKWCQKLCTFLFEVTFAFGKMCYIFYWKVVASKINKLWPGKDRSPSSSSLNKQKNSQGGSDQPGNSTPPKKTSLGSGKLTFITLFLCYTCTKEITLWFLIQDTTRKRNNTVPKKGHVSRAAWMRSKCAERMLFKIRLKGIIFSVNLFIKVASQIPLRRANLVQSREEGWPLPSNDLRSERPLRLLQNPPYLHPHHPITTRPHQANLQ